MEDVRRWRIHDRRWTNNDEMVNIIILRGLCYRCGKTNLKNKPNFNLGKIDLISYLTSEYSRIQSVGDRV